ncbi:hypothetical protein, partial [Acinetobacter sp.]|uniref:hypothetical protein n=1 Tax=Acinetobacter sp. TaxID=472 RepID=UPI003CFDEB5C
WGVSLSTHNVLSYAKRIDEICLGEWWQSKRWLCVSRILVAIHTQSGFETQPNIYTAYPLKEDFSFSLHDFYERIII